MRITISISIESVAVVLLLLTHAGHTEASEECSSFSLHSIDRNIRDWPNEQYGVKLANVEFHLHSNRSLKHIAINEQCASSIVSAAYSKLQLLKIGFNRHPLKISPTNASCIQASGHWHLLSDSGHNVNNLFEDFVGSAYPLYLITQHVWQPLAIRPNTTHIGGRRGSVSLKIPELYTNSADYVEFKSLLPAGSCIRFSSATAAGIVWR